MQDSTCKIHRIRGITPSVYKIAELSYLKGLPKTVKRAYLCPCGVLYAWLNAEQPPCPGCTKKQDGGITFVRRFSNIWTDGNKQAVALGYEDGVYVDVSLRNGHLTLGFVVVKDERAKLVSCSASNQRDTSISELEAILIAQHFWPEATIYCDHDEACRSAGATYIDRSRNRLAHSVARSRTNFQSWICV